MTSEQSQETNNGEASLVQDGEDLVQTLRDTLEKKELEIEELKKQPLYLRAEFDNFKKRQLREKEEFFKFANEGLLRELLGVLDNFEMGFATVPSNPEVKSFVEGMKLNSQLMIQLLERFGLQKVDALGKPFDPQFHEAVERKDADGSTVIAVLQSGYLLHGRLLRAARVVVGKDIN